MIKIAICDDEILLASEIEYLILDIANRNKIEVDVDVFYDGSTFLEYEKQGEIYDIIYLDIEMKEVDGIKTAQEMRKRGIQTLLIYVTSHESFAKDVFELDTFRFITKPIDKVRFDKFFLDACKKLEKSSGYFQYTYKKVLYRILLSDILYFQSDKRITYIIETKGEHICYEKLNDIEERLKVSGNPFYRVHQSFLINPQYVKKYSYDSMELIDGMEFTISERRRKSINELFCSIKGEEIIAF